MPLIGVISRLVESPLQALVVHRATQTQADPVEGGGPGGQEPPPPLTHTHTHTHTYTHLPFWGTSKLHKERKKRRSHARKCATF